MKKLSMAQIHSVLLDILTDIDAFCRKEGLRYSLAYGTLLGAVRYGDFIPWDDDADIVMPREDFERFIASYPNEGRFHCIHNNTGEKEFYLSGFAKVHDTTTDKFIGSKKYRSRYGVSVDIFPLDPLPEDPEERHALISKAMHYCRRLGCHNKYFFHSNPFTMLEAHMHSHQYWMDKCNEVVHTVKLEDTPYIGVMMGATGYYNVHPKNFLDRPAEINFAGHRFLCPEDTDKYLSQIYGPDYITPPPVEKRRTHGDPVYQL